MELRPFIRNLARRVGISHWARTAFMEAATAYERGSYVDAVRKWQGLAAEGDPDAQYMCLLVGSGIHSLGQPALALGWIHDAAGRGVAQVQQLLGDVYWSGRGITQDVPKGLSWYRKAAGQGLFTAQEYLGWHYLFGDRLRQDFSEALLWLHRAAEQGSVFAKLAFSVAYYSGRAVPQDESKAVEWFWEAASQDYVDDQRAHGLYYAAQPVASRRPRNDEEAVAFYALDAERGLDLAQYKLANRCVTGVGVPQSHIEAEKWFRRAAEQGLENAQFRLGLMHALGIGVSRDHMAAYKWLCLAAASKSGMNLASLARDSVAERMTVDEVREVQRLTREWAADSRPTASWRSSGL